MQLQQVELRRQQVDQQMMQKAMSWAHGIPYGGAARALSSYNTKLP
jgi:hypothetical protein